MVEKKYSNIYNRIKINLSLHVQLATIVLLTGGLLWMLFFTPIPATHDIFHASRHSIGILACH
jgi:hypothetical protein